MKRLITYLLCGAATMAASAESIDIAGTWTAVLDSEKAPAAVTLPGTLCDAGLGTPCALSPAMTAEVFLDLKRKYDYVGPASYTRTVAVPASWAGKRIFLDLERVLWRSEVWVNGKKAHGFNESLTTPHSFDLTDCIVPGSNNELMIKVDNTKQYDLSYKDMAHAYTNATQTMWNGVLGNMTLTTRPQTYIDHVRLTPDIATGTATVKVVFGGRKPVKGSVDFRMTAPDGRELRKVSVKAKGDTAAFTYTIPDAVLWDEHNPALYTWTADFRSGREKDSAEGTFGMREVTGDNGLLQVNGKRIFLRGALECCIFPLTGYPPTDEASWARIFDTARSYGLNHLRFHSWCPPEAAFAAADKAGLYLLVELPVWSLTIGDDSRVNGFMRDELHRILREYGNHPSFTFLSMGNELQHDFTVLDSLVREARAADSRHLYTATSFTFEKGHTGVPEPADQFWITQWTDDGWVRGQGIFDKEPVDFTKDYSASIKNFTTPVVTHEIGQYSVYPDLKEIPKYTGNLMPLNYMAVKEDLASKGRLRWAEENLKASGRLAAILYKEEIERALRTPGLSGFQLLGLQDFPGQSTALVGLLNSFWESKGIVSGDEMQQFCAPLVPLARFPKAVYNNSDTLRVDFEAANFTGSDIYSVQPRWLLSEGDNVIASGSLPQQNIAQGNALSLGSAVVPLAAVSKATQLLLTLNIGERRNSWKVWVYPDNDSADAGTDGVVFTRSWDEADSLLRLGRTVLLNPREDETEGLEGKFVQVFWSPVHFPDQPGTMGLWCDPSNPALADFPTDSHTDWQWWELCKSGRTLVLDSVAPDMNPVVRMTDNFFKNRNLALILEAKVGAGRLLLCTPDITESLDTRPAARQLRRSLMKYMSGKDFNPVYELTAEEMATFHKQKP